MLTSIGLNDLIRQVRRAARVEPLEHLADTELLRRFRTNRDQNAFELLLWRHGSMVLDTCRRTLRDAHEAEDAFQATFLTLVRKGESIRSGESVAGWLYRVAYRAAVALRRRRRPCPQDDGSLLEVRVRETVPVAENKELAELMCEEIHRLPVHYRDAFVLCCLEDRTCAEAGRELGCPRGTVASRLSRAREILRKRLIRRGLTAPLSMTMAVVTAQAATAPAPSPLIFSTLRAALAYAANPAGAAQVISSSVAALTQGVLQSMNRTAQAKLTAAFVVALLTVIGAGTAWRLAVATGEPIPTAGIAKDAPAVAEDPRPNKLLEQWPPDWSLFASEVVQKEIALSKEQKQHFTEAAEQLQRKHHGSEFLKEFEDLQAAGAEDKIYDLFQKVELQMRSEMDKEYRAQLKPEQYRRLREIDIQWDGARAYGRQIIIQSLKLSGDQQKAVKELAETTAKEIEDFCLNVGPIPEDPDEAKKAEEELAEGIRKIERKANERFLTQLTNEQKQAWKAVIGKPVERDFRFFFNGFKGSVEGLPPVKADAGRHSRKASGLVPIPNFSRTAETDDLAAKPADTPESSDPPKASETPKALDEWVVEYQVATSPSAQQEAGIGDKQLADTLKKLQSLHHEHFDAKLTKKLAALEPGTDDAKFAETIQQAHRDLNKAADSYLRKSLKAEQYRRLQQLSIQWRIPESLGNEIVVKSLKLNMAQKAAVERLVDDAGKEYQQARGMIEAFDPLDPDQADNIRKAEEMAKKMILETDKRALQRFVGVLDDDQKKLWEQLVGTFIPRDYGKPIRLDVQGSSK